MNLIFFLLFILFLAAGFFISRREEREKLKVYQETLNQIQTNEGNLEESWYALLNLKGISAAAPQDFKEQILKLEKKISDELFALNKLTEIPEPELIFEANPREFIPQKITFFEGKLYSFSPYAKNLFEINKEDEGRIIQIDKKISLAAALSDSVLFFSKPDQLIDFKDGEFGKTFSLPLPSSESEFNDFDSYKSNLYFLNAKSGQIVKYPYLWDQPQIWLEDKKATDFKSMAVDGSVWILTKSNSVERYYAGRLQETLNLDIFPSPKEFSKIFALAGLPYLYLLEPGQKRMVITNRTGEIIRQFRSDKFNNLLDFTVSEDGKIIYLLNGQKIYKIGLWFLFLSGKKE